MIKRDIIIYHHKIGLKGNLKMAKQYKSIEFEIENGTGKLTEKSSLTQRDIDILTLGNAIYIYKGEKDVYIGQTKNFYKRHIQHVGEAKKTRPNTKYIDGSFKTVIVAFSAKLITQESLDDIECKFITYLTADNDDTGITVSNHTEGNRSIAYPYQDEVVENFIIPYWKDLYSLGYVNHETLDDVKTSILFKYSPFFSLSDEQQGVIRKILACCGDSIVYGLAGTGKTVLITNLAIEYSKMYPDAKIAIAAQSNWVDSGKKIFKAYGAENISVDTPVVIYRTGEYYDLILVDEAHRLRRYYSKTNHIRDDIFEVTKDPSTGKPVPKYNELEQLAKQSDHLVLFYDPMQSIKPTDIRPEEFTRILDENNFSKYYLAREYRVTINDKDRRFTGDDYVHGILSFLQMDERPFKKELFSDYLTNGEDAYFGIVDSIQELFDYLDTMEIYSTKTINRVLAGYTKEWVSQKDKTRFDWIERENRWQWNSTNKNWINQKNSRYEIGCIHSIQGVDLNYAGVIISDDLKIKDGILYGDINSYKDENGKFTKTDFDQAAFTDYIKNIYYVLLTRGISGIRVYFENKEVEQYFKELFHL